jgi:glycosyltransferase involved in cell wall biosynthesis
MKQPNDINLLIITDSYWPAIGGIEKTIFALSTCLPKRFKLSILTHRFPPGSKTLFQNYWTFIPHPLKDSNDNTIIPLKVAFHTKLVLLPLLLWNFPGIRLFFRAEYLFDLLYHFYKAAFYIAVNTVVSHTNIVHCYSTGWLARLTTEICLKQGVPFVHSPAVHFGKWGDSPAQLKSYTSANALICFSEDVKKKILAHSGILNDSHVQVIPPVQQALSVSEPLKRLIDEPYILFLGRREQHKGLHLLIEAHRKIEQPIKLVIAGPGEKFAGTDSSIIDMGAVSDEEKKALLTHCELFTLPSTDETFGIVYTEAMSCGKPVVAINIAPVNEIVQNGVTGILVSSDNPDALTVALTTLLADHDLSRSLGKRGQEVFNERYSPSVVVPRIVEVYDKISTIIG